MGTAIEKILELMKKDNITPYRLCKDNNIPHASFLQIRKGNADFQLKHIISVAKYFNISLDELTGLKSNPNKFDGDEIGDHFVGEQKNDYINDSKQRNILNVPIVGSVGCGTPMHSWENFGDEYVTISDINHFQNPFILIAKGDSMRPYINPGDKLVCADEPRLIKDRKAVIVSFKTEPETSDANAKLIKMLPHDIVMLYSINTKYDPIIVNKKDIYKIFKLIRIIRDVK